MNKKIDELGRVVIPIGIRKRLGIEPLDEVRIDITDNDLIIISKIKQSSLDEFLEELKYNSKKGFDSKVSIEYVIDRLEDIKSGR